MEAPREPHSVSLKGTFSPVCLASVVVNVEQCCGKSRVQRIPMLSLNLHSLSRPSLSQAATFPSSWQNPTLIKDPSHALNLPKGIDEDFYLSPIVKALFRWIITISNLLLLAHFTTSFWTGLCG